MLYIYSGEVPELNRRLIDQLGKKYVITTIPASPGDMASAKHVTDYFRHSGLRARLQNTRYYRDVKRLRQIINNSDAVYLMGGNTFDFLAYAIRSDLFDMLREFETNGGIILSESAGSIILSADIATALIPTTCPDEQDTELESYAGMGRIPFHVSPHFDPQAEVAVNELDELQALAHVSGVPVLVLQDGEGIVLDKNEIIHTTGAPAMLNVEDEPSHQFDAEALLPHWLTRV